jgi:hypothetical protein
VRPRPPAQRTYDPSLVWGSGRTVIRASVGRLRIRRSLGWRWSSASRISRVRRGAARLRSVVRGLRRRAIAVGIGGSGIRSRSSRLRRCRTRSWGRSSGSRRCRARIWIGSSGRRLARGCILTRTSRVASCRSCATRTCALRHHPGCREQYKR